MKKTRRRYDREFKISVVAELESGKPLAQIAREHSIHLALPSRWREELAENPEKAFSGNGNQYKDQARIAELERLLGQAHAEIDSGSGDYLDAYKEFIGYAASKNASFVSTLELVNDTMARNPLDHVPSVMAKPDCPECDKMKSPGELS
jgi:transposase